MLFDTASSVVTLLLYAFRNTPGFFQILTLINGDRIPLTSSMSLLFEVSDGVVSPSGLDLILYRRAHLVPR